MFMVAAAPLPASAEQATISGGFYWSAQPDPLPPPVGSPAPLPSPDVPAGDFAVAAKHGPSADQQSDKESYLHVDLSAVPAGAKLGELKLTLKEDAAGANLNSAAAVIEAHPVTAFFADGATGGPYSQRPAFDAAAAAKGTRGGDGSWTFDLTSLVQGKEASSFFGVAMIPKPAAPTDGFEVVWSGKDSTATYAVSGGTSEAPAVSGGFLAPPPASGSGLANTPSTSNSSSRSFTGGSAASSTGSTPSG